VNYGGCPLSGASFTNEFDLFILCISFGHNDMSRPAFISALNETSSKNVQLTYWKLFKFLSGVALSTCTHHKLQQLFTNTKLHNFCRFCVITRQINYETSTIIICYGTRSFMKLTMQNITKTKIYVLPTGSPSSPEKPRGPFSPESPCPHARIHSMIIAIINIELSQFKVNLNFWNDSSGMFFFEV